MTERGPYAKGVAARKRRLRAAATAAADLHGQLDLVPLAGAAQPTTGRQLRHFPNRDAVLVAVAMELADDVDTSADEHLASPANSSALSVTGQAEHRKTPIGHCVTLRTNPNSSTTRHLGSLLSTVSHRAAGLRTSEAGQDGE